MEKKYPYSYQLETPGSLIKPQTLIKEISDQAQTYNKELLLLLG